MSDRDCSRFKLSTAETQKRRALFWELFITDCWQVRQAQAYVLYKLTILCQALATGRLPTFELGFVDTELPADPDETLADDGTPQPSCESTLLGRSCVSLTPTMVVPAWKARWGKECVSPVVMGTLTAQAPKYSAILELDRRIRDVSLPKYSQGPPPQNAGLSQTMSYYMPINYLHFSTFMTLLPLGAPLIYLGLTALLYVHRCFFAHALTDHPSDPMRSQYAPSFLAGYRSACTLLSTLREQFALFPTQIARFWVLWTHAFSACVSTAGSAGYIDPSTDAIHQVMMGSVVTRGGTTKTAQAALGELRLACDLFERAAQHGGRALKFVVRARRQLPPPGSVD